MSTSAPTTVHVAGFTTLVNGVPGQPILNFQERGGYGEDVVVWRLPLSVCVDGCERVYLAGSCNYGSLVLNPPSAPLQLYFQESNIYVHPILMKNQLEDAVAFGGGLVCYTIRCADDCRKINMETRGFFWVYEPA